MSADYHYDLDVGSRSGRLSALSSSVNSVEPRRGYVTHFRDTLIRHTLDEAAVEEEGPSYASALLASPRPKRLEKAKLVIVLVGLPGRGKTYVGNKIVGYLQWCAGVLRSGVRFKALQCPPDRPSRRRLGHVCRHFNVGLYRRQKRASAQDLQDASFFDHNNQVGRAEGLGCAGAR